MNILTRFPSRLPVLMIILAFALSGCGSNPQSPQAIIDQMARDLKSQLPKKLDQDTALVNVYTNKLEIVSEYELLNFDSNDPNRAAAAATIESYLKTEVCPGIKTELLNRGISAKYAYKGKDGQLLFEKVLKPGDC